MVTGQRVLVVNGIPETEAVLKAVFERRGHHVQRVRSGPAQGSWPTSERPSVVVVDADETDGDPVGLWSNVPRVVLADRTIAAGRFAVSDATRDALFLEKPCQYPELVRAIEQLLQSAAGSTDAVSDAQERQVA